MTQLPFPIPEKWWTDIDQRAIPAAMAAAAAPGWNPKRTVLDGTLIAVDYSFCGDSPSSMLVLSFEDHQFLRTLEDMKNTPRKVRHLYRSDVRTRYATAKDGWDFLSDWNAANDAWKEYLDNSMKMA